MFINNKYLKHYNNLCDKARSRSTIEGYFEKHHVIPRSLGGTDDSSNIVLLSAREHYIAHKILVRITSGVFKFKMINAWFRMSCQGINPAFAFINSRKFEQARIAFTNTAGWALRGRTYEQIHGAERAQELKQQRSTQKSYERKGKSWEEIFGSKKAAEMKQIRGAQSIVWNTGRKHSPETRSLISQAAKQRTYKTVECLCGRHITTHNLVKHQLSCKLISKREDL